MEGRTIATLWPSPCGPGGDRGSLRTVKGSLPRRNESPAADPAPGLLAEGMVTLAEVVRRGSFRATADALGTTTSAISKRIARLEEQLGVRLLARTTRRIALTEAGVRFHEHALRVLDLLHETAREARTDRDAPRGTLRVTAPVVFGERHVAPLLARFAAEHPAVRIDLSLSDRFVDLVDEGFDCAIRIGVPPDSSLVVRKLTRIPMLVVASPAYLAARGEPRSPDDLVGHTCIRYSITPSQGAWRFGGDGGDRMVPVAEIHATNHGGAMRELVAEGAGLARMPLFEIEDLVRGGRLVEVLRPFRARPLELMVARAARRHAPAKVLRFVELAAAELPRRLRAR